MKHVTVGIITFRRPAELRRLLQALAEQDRSEERPFRLSVLVVDNDSKESARPVFSDICELYPALEARYVVEPRQGIPIARNKVLDNTLDCEFLAFIDDDEVPCPNWLDALLKTQAETEADCVWGPVRPAYPEGARGFLVRSGLLDQSRIPLRMLTSGQPIQVAATGNVLLKNSRIREFSMRFNEALRFTGGEDLLFFKNAARDGLKIFWCPEAMVDESVPAWRLTWSYVLKRQYRIGNDYYRANFFDIKRRHKFNYALLSVALFWFGVGELIFCRTIERRFEGFAKMVNSFGIAGAIVGIFSQEYLSAPTSTVE